MWNRIGCLSNWEFHAALALIFLFGLILWSSLYCNMEYGICWGMLWPNWIKDVFWKWNSARWTCNLCWPLTLSENYQENRKKFDSNILILYVFSVLLIFSNKLTQNTTLTNYSSFINKYMKYNNKKSYKNDTKQKQ